MDKVKAAYGYAKSVHGYAVSWVAAHPAATVNAIFAVVVLKVVSKIFI
ncbi:hypothetical protein V1279_003035 [Bradyrhizobium sp. AZCC 1610]